MSTLVWSVVTTVQGRVPVASEGLSLIVSSYNGEDILVSFGGYNGRYNSEVNVLKPSHKSTLQSKIIETPVPDSVSAVHNTNATRDLESEFEAGQEGKIREIVMDNVDSEPVKSKGEQSNIHLVANLKSEKEELESLLSKEKMHSLQLKQELSEAENRDTELYKELQSVRGQLAAEQSRCFKLEVDVAELRQKLQTMETLQKELELLRRQKAASEQAALNAKQRQGSVTPIKGVTSIDIEDGNLIDSPPPVLGDGNVLLNVFPYCSFDENVAIWVAYTVPDKYFINCGAGINTTIDDGRVFVGDQNSCSFSTGKSEHVMSSNSSIGTPLLYQTARVYRQPCSYKFEINQNGTYIVRLHFFVFLSPANLSDALFNKENLKSTSYLLKSLLLAFINAIEVFLAPEAFLHDSAPHVTSAGDEGFINVSLVTRQDSPLHYAFLNGLEIMEFMKESGPTPKEGMKGEADQSSGVLLYGGTSFKKKLTERNANASLPSTLNLSLRISLAEIKYATKNFNAKFLIGEGGFGKVYKGTLRSGMKVAVKRSEPGHGQGLKEFQTEIIVLSQIRHRHLVSLIGYCDEGSEMILVYEFMEKGTLRDHLYHSNGNSQKSSSRFELSWKQRLEICIGAAKGLHYLHTGPAGGILHRDVKSTNIFLDEDYVAKVGDFGLSKSGLSDTDHFTMAIKGSFGYLDPEYLRTLQFTEKSDVYSFGVVLLELLCARPAVDNSLQAEEVSLAEWGMLWLGKGQLENIIDPVLVGKIKPSSLKKFGEIAEKCLKADTAERPDMHEVLWDLAFALQLQEIAINREPHEDSLTNTSLELQLPVWHLPSTRILNEEEDISNTASEV
uniref:Protein kinase domain-containing protein n=1 Tax=Fagus sylvatica TaxID=28930 RepID=A0A2N9FZU8_FAGSY